MRRQRGKITTNVNYNVEINRVVEGSFPLCEHEVAGLWKAMNGGTLLHAQEKKKMEGFLSRIRFPFKGSSNFYISGWARMGARPALWGEGPQSAPRGQRHMEGVAPPPEYMARKLERPGRNGCNLAFVVVCLCI